MIVKRYVGNVGSYNKVDTTTGKIVGQYMNRPQTTATDVAPGLTTNGSSSTAFERGLLPMEAFVPQSDLLANPLQTTPDWNTGGRKDPVTVSEEEAMSGWLLVAVAVGIYMIARK